MWARETLYRVFAADIWKGPTLANGGPQRERLRIPRRQFLDEACVTHGCQFFAF